MRSTHYIYSKLSTERFNSVSDTDSASSSERSLPSNQPSLQETCMSSTPHSQKNRLTQIVRTLINRLRNIDGIDEAAASLVLIRGITGPIAAESVFVFGFPFVVFGLIGMMEESAQAKQALSDLLKETEDLKSQVQQIIKLDAKPDDRSRRAQKQQLKTLKQQVHAALNSLPAQARQEKMQACISLFAKLHALKSTQTEKLMQRCAAPFGTVAMAGMTAGMLPGIAWGAAEISARALGQTTPEMATHLGQASLAAQVSAIAGAAVSLVFAPANAAMVGYAACKGLAGIQQGRRLDQVYRQVKAREAEANQSSRQASKVFEQYTQAEKRSNRLTQSLYGLFTGAGQTALAASGGVSIAAFFGATAAAAALGTGGIVLPIAGAAAAIGAAIMRIQGEITQEIRHGDQEQAAPRTEKVHMDCESQLLQAHQDLAQNKLLSLAYRAIKKHPNIEHRHRAIKRWVVEMKGRRGRLIGQGTSLLPETVEQMRKLYYSDKMSQTINNAFSQTKPGAAAKILLTHAGHPDIDDLATPILIQSLKNDSKVRMHSAFELMSEHTELANVERPLPQCKEFFV